jgi:hypothetical protein
VIAVVVFAACVGGDEGGFGVYESSADGATFTFTIPASESASEIAELEAYRQAVGAPPVSYVLAAGQNNGDEEVSIPTLSIVTESGQTITTVVAWQRVGDWQNLASDTVRYNEGVRLYNESLRSDDLFPGARSTAVLIADGTIDSVKSVFVDRSLLDAMEAFAEQGGTPKPIKAKKISDIASTNGSVIETSTQVASATENPAAAPIPTLQSTPIPQPSPEPTTMPTAGPSPTPDPRSGTVPGNAFAGSRFRFAGVEADEQTWVIRFVPSEDLLKEGERIFGYDSPADDEGRIPCNLPARASGKPRIPHHYFDQTGGFLATNDLIVVMISPTDTPSECRTVGFVFVGLQSGGDGSWVHTADLRLIN